jgi:hypothetical protein
MHKDSKVRQELYRANQYEKPRQDAGVFIIYNLLLDRKSVDFRSRLRIIAFILILEFLVLYLCNRN